MATETDSPTPAKLAAIKLKQVSEAERIKAASNFLRGTIVESLSDASTGAVADKDNGLLKFHGAYQQDDRDVRKQRASEKLEPAYGFMVRVRTSGGVVTPAQWLVLDDLATKYGGGTLRLTTRQSFQLHRILKGNLKTVVAEVNHALLTTLGACGDITRCVMCSPNPMESEIHGQVHAWCQKIGAHLQPKTTAYHEIWLGGEKVVDSRGDDEPLYGPTYLPRKFKVNIAIPPINDVDVLAHDLGLIAIVDKGRLEGFDVTVGGGMGMSAGNKATYPNLAQGIGFCRPEQVVDLAEKVLTVQRDFGDRTNRKHARLKYTIDDRGLEWFRTELQRRLGWELEPERPYTFAHHGDRYGWVSGSDGNWHLTLFIENGRVCDSEEASVLTGLRRIAEVHDGEFRLTPNQHLIISRISPNNRPRIERLVRQYGLSDGSRESAIRRNASACVGLPTCGLAMGESERYLPVFLGKLEKVLADAGLADDEIVLRMTGCPNGCARPYVAEIALVAKGHEKYDLYLGADFAGTRLNKLYKASLTEPEILETLTPLFARYAAERQPGEHFGDFTIRAGYVRAVTAGREFHA